MNISTGDLKWSSVAGWDIPSTPFIWNGFLYCGSDMNALYVFDAATGKERGIFNTYAQVYASPVQYNDTVYFGSEDGRVYALDLDKTIPGN